MQVTLYSVMAAMLLVASLSLTGPAATSAQGDWQNLQSRPGPGSGATDQFDAWGRELRIRGNVQDSRGVGGGGGASLQIQVYQQTTPTDTLVTTINAPGPGGQSTIMPPEAGQYYLQITPITGSQPQWTVTVDQRPS